MSKKDSGWLVVVVVLLGLAVWGVFFQKTVEVREVEVFPVSADLTEVKNRLDELQEGQEDIAKALIDLPKEIASAMPEMPEAVVVAAEEPSPPATSTSVPNTPTPVPPSSGSGFVPYEQEGGIPWSGAAWSADVAPDEIEVLTAGPANIAGVSLPGGVDRGSVIVFLPDPKKVVQYTVTGLVTGANWHGSYRPLTDPTTESTWRILANDRVAAMQEAPNCTSGLGCVIIDVLVVGPEGVVAQWVVQ